MSERNVTLMSTIKLGALSVAGMAFLAMGGCKGGGTTSDTSTPAATATASAAAPNVDFGTDVGIEVKQGEDPNQLKNLIAMQAVHPRKDPFSLNGSELTFDRDQATQRLVSTAGNMDTLYEPPPPPSDIPPVVEPQPYRRVSGILVGDSVLAIIEMGDGGDPVIVRPGDFIKNTPWQVVSIDEEKVVLRRAGNVLPKEITIRLEQKLDLGGGAGAPGTAGPGTFGPGSGRGPAGAGPGGGPAGGPAGD